MTDVFLMDSLADYLTIDTPDDYNGTVAYVHGHVIGIQTPPAWANDVWRGGAIEMTSGDAQRFRMVIMASVNDQLILASPFLGTKTPKQGDTFKLSGGPLSQAVLYLEEPATLDEEWKKNGKRFFVVIDAVAGLIVPSGMGGRSHSGVEATKSGFSFELVAFTKNVTGKAGEDIYRVFYDMPLFKEQVIRLALAWRTDAANGFKGESEVAWGKLLFQLSGTDPLRGYTIQFDVSLGRGN